MGGPNLEVFKFGMYILFPIGWMYYFGTNLDNKFSVPDFWPKPEMTHKIPFEREEILSELERLKKRRLALRDKRLAEEASERGEVVQEEVRTVGVDEAHHLGGERVRGLEGSLDAPPRSTGVMAGLRRHQEGWRD